MSTAAADRAWQASSPAGPAETGQAFRRLVDSVDRRWTLVRLAEAGSVGWMAGVAASAILLAAGTAGGLLLLVPPVVLAVIAAAGQRRRSANAAADRLDHVFGTKELFGTAARVSGGPEGRLLAIAADGAAARLSAAEVPLARFRRWWWAVVVTATAALAAGGWMATGAAESGAGERIGSQFAKRGALLSLDADEQAGERARTAAPPAPQPAESGSAQTTINPTNQATSGTSRARDRAAASGAGNASSAGGTSAATSEDAPRPDRSDVRSPKAAQSGETRETANGNAGPPGDGRAGGDAHPGELTAPRPRNSSETTTGGSGGEDIAPDQRVPAEYRELVRRYFSGGP